MFHPETFSDTTNFLTFLDWGAAGVGTDDSNTGKWADSLIGDLVFPDKKPKEIVEGDDDPKDKDTNNEDVKGWFDGHPEIGKMQKNGMPYEFVHNFVPTYVFLLLSNQARL